MVYIIILLEIIIKVLNIYYYLKIVNNIKINLLWY